VHLFSEESSAFVLKTVFTRKSFATRAMHPREAHVENHWLKWYQSTLTESTGTDIVYVGQTFIWDISFCFLPFVLPSSCCFALPMWRASQKACCQALLHHPHEKHFAPWCGLAPC